MSHNPLLRRARALLLLLCSLSSPVAAAMHARIAPQREHLTPEEVELVRNNQELDKRTGVFVKAVERRLGALSDPKTAEKLSEKELAQWGTINGTSTQLLSDVEHILEEAITNIEDASIHSEKSSLIPSSLRKLGEAAKGFLPRVQSLRDRLEGEAAQASLNRVTESLEEIITAAGKLPAEEKKAAEKKKEGRSKN